MRLSCIKRAPGSRIMTTGGAGGDPVFTEGGVGRAYLIQPAACRPKPSSSRTKAKAPSNPLPWPREIMRRMGLHSAIVVSDGYHIYRVKRMLEAPRHPVYGSPRKALRVRPFHDRWNNFKQAIGYLLWSIGLGT